MVQSLCEMLLESMVSILFLFCVICLNNNFLETSPVQVDIYENLTDLPHIIVREVPLGDTITLKCRSNDKNHNFLYWHIGDKNNTIVGPTNKDFSSLKYKYEVLSGNLTIKRVSRNEEGIYNCVSRGVRHNDYNIRSVRMVISGNQAEQYNYAEAEDNHFRIIVVLCTFVILGFIGYFAYKIWKDRYRHPSYLVPSEDEDDEDDSGEEIFRAPGTSKRQSNENGDTAGIDTDFKSILDTANSK